MGWLIPLVLALAPAHAVQAPAPDQTSYVFLTQNGDSNTINASTGDLFHANRFRSGNSPLLYAREGGTAYVIRDPAVVGQAREILRPQEELGVRQGALGRKQGDLGERQAKVGAEQARLGLLIQQTQTPARMSEIAARQAILNSQQIALGAEQAELGAQQAAMGAQQAELALAAQSRLRALVDDAVRRGLAQRVD